VLLLPKHLNLSIVSVPDEGYRRNASCALNLISTFVFIFYMILMTYRDNPEGDILSLAVLLFVLRNIHIVVMFHKMPPEIILTSTDDY
jgi:hypothetical protein